MEKLRSNLNHLRFRYKLFTEKHQESSKLALTGDSASGADPGFLLGGGAPLRNGVTDW